MIIRGLGETAIWVWTEGRKLISGEIGSLLPRNGVGNRPYKNCVELGHALADSGGMENKNTIDSASDSAKRIIVCPGRPTSYLKSISPQETVFTDKRENALRMNASESVYALHHVTCYGRSAYVAFEY